MQIFFDIFNAISSTMTIINCEVAIKMLGIRKLKKKEKETKKQREQKRGEKKGKEKGKEKEKEKRVKN